MIKTRQQGSFDSASPRRGALPILRAVVAEEGLAALWRGWGPSLARVTLGVGVYFAALDVLAGAPLSVAHRHRRDLAHTSDLRVAAAGDVSPLRAFLSGAAARCIAAGIFTPLTVVKVRGPG